MLGTDVTTLKAAAIYSAYKPYGYDALDRNNKNLGDFSHDKDHCLNPKRNPMVSLTLIQTYAGL